MADEILLDDVMSKEDQKKTGVSKLTLVQKVELEKWINKTLTLKNHPQAAVVSLTMSINIDNGQKLQLSDNSTWEVAPDDVQKASLWILPFPIKLSPSNDPNYPTLITNVTSGESVRAKQWVPTPTGTPQTTPAPSPNPPQQPQGTKPPPPTTSPSSKAARK